MDLKEAINLSIEKIELMVKHPEMSYSGISKLIHKKRPVLRVLENMCGLCEKYRVICYCESECPLLEKHKLSRYSYCCYEYAKWRFATLPRWRKHWAQKLLDRLKAIKVMEVENDKR